VRELLPRHFIVRTAWLYADHGRNFVLSILRKAQEALAGAQAGGAAPTLRVVADQIGSPTSAADLADAIARHIVDSRRYGTYHITNAGSCSWAEFAAEALRLAGSPARVEPISSRDWPSPTRRPAYSVLRRLSLEMQGRDDMQPWQEALAEVVGAIQAGSGRE
jgi:dTDP-4-dehydrorhamnose reductase